MPSLRFQPRREPSGETLELPQPNLSAVVVFEPPPSEPQQTADEPASADGAPGYPVLDSKPEET